MKTKKRMHRIGIVLLAAMMLVVFGCSSNNGNSKSAPTPGTSETPAGQEPVTVTVRVGSWWESNIPAIIEAYKKDYPHVTLKIEALPINGYIDSAITAELGGNSPDVLDLDLWMLPELAGKGMLETWDDYIDDLDVDDFLPAVWNNSFIDGNLYGVPSRAESNVYYYNKTMFDEANVPYPASDWTWEDMLEIVKQITVPGEKYGLGIAASLSDQANVSASFSPVLWSFGGDYLNEDYTAAAINSPESVAAITWWTELYTKHKVVPEGSINYALTKDIQPMFLNNQVAMFPTGSNFLQPLADHPEVKWGMVYGPSYSGKGTGWAFTIPKSAKQKEAAREFVLWFMKAENMAQFNPRSPSIKSAYTIPPWNTPDVEYLLSAAPYQRMEPPVTGYSQMLSVVVTELQKVLAEVKTPQQAADDMAEQINALLK